MSKGKQCYGNLTLYWQLDRPRNICLFSQTDKRPIYCWSKRLQGNYEGSFVLFESNKYSIVDIESKEVLMTETISVTWVFQESRQRRRWRLF
ncbi:signal peptide-containing protein [Glaciecola sp. KUL10]|nr:signal peptide-containing protein [Glaciecola sp. KUL10]